LEALSKVQLQPEHLSKLTSIASIQTKGLKKHFLEQENGDKFRQKYRGDENELEMQNISNVADSRKHKWLLMMDMDVNKTSEEKDPNVVGFEVICSLKHS
jgi:hypothetical protein